MKSSQKQAVRRGKNVNLPRDTDATSQVIAFIVAGAIFMASVGAVLLASQGAAADPTAPDDAVRTRDAKSLVDMLVGSPGVAGESGPDGLIRLGFAAHNGSGLQQSSLDALRGAGMVADGGNGLVDYEEAQRSLGLSPGGAQEFHLRIYPVLPKDSADNAGTTLRVAYVADWASIATAKVPMGTPTDQMIQQANAQLNLTMAAGTDLERNALDGIGLDFNNQVYYTGTTAPIVVVDMPDSKPDRPILEAVNEPFLDGDVYPDDKAYLTATLPGRLAQYDILVIGSGVDHSSLTPDAIKNGIRDWVLGGGELVVLGTESTGSWLQPLFHVGQDSANGAPSATDSGHPLLHQPYDLAWTSYDNHGKAWDIKSQGSGARYEDFSHVVMADGGTILAISNEGAFGTGRIVLSNYLVREIAASFGAAEASHFFINIIAMEEHKDLYLDYGPAIPKGVASAVAVRQSWLDGGALGTVPMRVEVHVWG